MKKYMATWDQGRTQAFGPKGPWSQGSHAPWGCDSSEVAPLRPQGPKGQARALGPLWSEFANNAYVWT